MQQALEETVRQMRSLALTISPYSFPHSTHQDEIDLACLKQREIEVDGYDLGVHFNIADHGKFKLESLQVFGKYFTYLPFRVVAKVAVAFLGDKELTLAEIMHSRSVDIDKHCRKIYLWTVYFNSDGERTSSPFYKRSKEVEVDGFKFYRVAEREFNFF